MKKFIIAFIVLFASTAYGAYQDDYPNKTTPVDGDKISIVDSEDLNALSKGKVKNLLLSDLTDFMQSALTFTEGAGLDDINDLTEVTPATGDYLPFYDTTGVVVGKATIDDLQAVNQLYIKADRVTQRYEVTAATDSIAAADLLTHKYITNQGAAAEVEVTLPDISYTLLNVGLVEEAQTLTICPPSGETLDSDTVPALGVDDCISSPAEVGAKVTIIRMKDASGDWIYTVDTVTSAEEITYTKCITINAADTDADFMVTSFPFPVTITELKLNQIGATNVIGMFDECNSSGASCVAIDTTDLTATTTQAKDSSPTNADIDTDDVISWHTTSVSGTNTQAMACFDYTID